MVGKNGLIAEIARMKECTEDYPCVVTLWHNILKKSGDTENFFYSLGVCHTSKDVLERCKKFFAQVDVSDTDCIYLTGNPLGDLIIIGHPL